MSDVRMLATIEDGATVLGSDGRKIGSIVAVRSNYLVAERGFVVPIDYFVPLNAVAAVNHDTVLLNISSDTALGNRWDKFPYDFDDRHSYMNDETTRRH